MKANSDKKPTVFTKSGGKLFYNFNAIESQREDKTTFFEYEYIEVANKDKKSVIQAIMRDKYSIEDEIALINNKFRAQPQDIIDYDKYQGIRAAVKDVVNVEEKK